MARPHGFPDLKWEDYRSVHIVYTARGDVGWFFRFAGHVGNMRKLAEARREVHSLIDEMIDGPLPAYVPAFGGEAEIIPLGEAA